jgi:hypothetical protein
MVNVDILRRRHQGRAYASGVHPKSPLLGRQLVVAKSESRRERASIIHASCSADKFPPFHHRLTKPVQANPMAVATINTTSKTAIVKPISMPR